MTDATALRDFDERVVVVKRGRIRYYAAGAGEPIVLVHGLGGAASNWVELAGELARRRRVLIPELPGHGGSDPLAAPPTIAQFADRIARVLEAEDAVPALVVGHSLGAVVVVRLALRRTDAVRGIVLVSAAGIASATRRAKQILTVTTLVQPGRFVAPFRAHVGRSALLRRLVFGYWGSPDPAQLSARATDGFLAGPPQHTDVRGAARALYVDDPRAELAELRCPALVLWGAADVQVPLTDAFEYARRLRAGVRVVPGAGHLLIGERPDACLDAVESFADGLEGHIAATASNGVSAAAAAPSGGDRN
jgi:pimeloyl-ACP methyl ester carboxylesterase